MSRFIVLGRDSILTGYNSFEECLQYIRETRKKYPNHVDMTIYKMEFKEQINKPTKMDEKIINIVHWIEVIFVLEGLLKEKQQNSDKDE